VDREGTDRSNAGKAGGPPWSGAGFPQWGQWGQRLRLVAPQVLLVVWATISIWLVTDYVVSHPAEIEHQRNILVGANVSVLVITVIGLRFLPFVLLPGRLSPAVPAGGDADAVPDIGHLAGAVDHLAEQLNVQLAELSQQTLRDPLTQLPNRALFMDRVKRALARATRQEATVAILYIDLDDFKVVNDTLGHEAGDQVLMAISERLQMCLRNEDTAARLGGDEFTALIDDVPSLADALQIAERVVEQLQAPFAVLGRQVRAGASVGVAFSRGGTTGLEELLRQADAAMYRAKGSGKGRYVIYDPAIDGTFDSSPLAPNAEAIPA